jgi:hypothetical protein
MLRIPIQSQKKASQTDHHKQKQQITFLEAKAPLRKVAEKIRQTKQKPKFRERDR